MKTMFGSMVRGSVVACVLAASLAVAGTAAARDEVDPNNCVPDPTGGLSAVICTIGSSGSPSSFLGSFASDNNGKGGWVEFYSDDEGEWWVEHHADGGTQVGWDVGGFGQNIAGPKLDFGTPEGKYAQKPRPGLKGALTTVPKRSFAAVKAAATTKTATINLLSAPLKAYTLTSGTPVEISLGGSGQCKAAIIVQRNGQLVSSTGIVQVSFPSKRTVQLPSTPGNYTVSIRGKNGCLDQVRTANVTLETARRVAFPTPMRVSAR